MTLANKVTASRLVLAPLFFVIFLLPRFFPAVFADAHLLWPVIALWALFIGSAITDMLDGMIARRRGQTSDFGKFFDPFADTLTQVTYFFCFVIEGILHPVLFLAVLYREFSILFIRNMMLRKGVAMGARIGGKIKTVSYISAVAVALLAFSVQRIGILSDFYRHLVTAASVVFAVSVVIAIVSLFDYILVYRKAPGVKE